MIQLKKILICCLATMFLACNSENSYMPSEKSMSSQVSGYLADEEVDVDLSANNLSGDIDFESADETSNGDDYTATAERTSNTSAQKLLASADKKETSDNKQQAQSTKKLKKNQKIIRTANIEMEVEKYEKARTALAKIVNEFDAIIEKEAEKRSTYRIQNNFVIRVQPEKLENFITAITATSIDVDSKSISSRDVTRQYVDLETRLGSKHAVIKRYRAILTTAKTIKDILNVEEHLRTVVEEVESMEGQLRVLKDKVGESTLNLYVYENFDSPAVKKRGFFNRMASALGNGWKGGQSMLIGFVSVWPFWILLGGLIWFLRRAWRKRKRNV